MKKLVLIFLSVICCLGIAGKIMDTKYKNFWHPFFTKLDVLIDDSSRYDAVFFGNSRTHFGINPFYIDSITNLRSYNFGMGGAPITEINFLAEVYLQKHPAPKYALISIGYGGIIDSSKYFENPCYYFFYTHNKVVRSVLDSLKYHTSLFSTLPVLKYTSFDDFNKFSVAENMSGKTVVKPGGVIYKGFINNPVNASNLNFKNETVNNDKPFVPGINTLERTILLFKEKKALPILIYPPSSSIEKEHPKIAVLQIDSIIHNLSLKYNIPVWHYDTDSSFTDNYFQDPSHLNISGTVIYSKKIGEKIKAMQINDKFPDR